MVPRVCYAALNSTTAIHGNYKESCFHFNHRSVTSISIQLGSQVFPSPRGFERLVFTGTEIDYTQAYLSLFDQNLKENDGECMTTTTITNSTSSTNDTNNPFFFFL